MKRVVRLNESELKAMIYEAISRILEDDDKKNVKPTQWYDTYVNKESGEKKDGDVVQMRLNPKTMKPEFKSPTSDKVYDTRDDAINALNNGGDKKKLNELFSVEYPNGGGNIKNEIKRITNLAIATYKKETGKKYWGVEFWPIKTVLDSFGYVPCGNNLWCNGGLRLEIYFDKDDNMWHIDPAE